MMTHHHHHHHHRRRASPAPVTLDLAHARAPFLGLGLDLESHCHRRCCCDPSLVARPSPQPPLTCPPLALAPLEAAPFSWKQGSRPCVCSFLLAGQRKATGFHHCCCHHCCCCCSRCPRLQKRRSRCHRMNRPQWTRRRNTSCRSGRWTLLPVPPSSFGCGTFCPASAPSPSLEPAPPHASSLHGAGARMRRGAPCARHQTGRGASSGLWLAALLRAAWILFSFPDVHPAQLRWPVHPAPQLLLLLLPLHCGP